MKKEINSFEYEVVNNSDITSEESLLIIKAKEASLKAYAPYSEFYVGAAVLLDNGQVITGNNQENMAFPSGLCAERVAIFYAKSQFPEAKIIGISVVAQSRKYVQKMPVSPCGACRQVMIEYEMLQHQPYWILLWNMEQEIGYRIPSVSLLLPLNFMLQS
ncbi:MAG: cytidine deaminase [Bacteroidales bacterium]|nr:cytidine deaminase [Bacteroidales bacterium]